MGAHKDLLTDITSCVRVAITTRYLGPTNHRGSRIVAQSGNWRADRSDGMRHHKLTVFWDDALGAQENHAAAALALITRLEWLNQYPAGRWAMGSTETGYVFVWCAEESR